MHTKHCNTHTYRKSTATKVKICSLTLCGRILSAIFLLLALERGRERQRERGKREHVTMVTDSVAPRPSAKMLGHIQHPSIPAVCACAYVRVCARVFVCNAAVHLESESLQQPKKCHITHLLPDMYSLRAHTQTHRHTHNTPAPQKPAKHLHLHVSPGLPTLP